MKLELAFEHACNGRAILFTGAGASIDAINLKNSYFKTGGQLAAYLATQVGMDVNINLAIAAEEYKLKFGEEKLIQELQKEFSAKRVDESHTALAQIPWKRIYTTNYDNVMETAYSKVGKKLLPITIEQDMGRIPKSTTLCVHLNGFIDQLNNETLDNDFKLTESSYIASTIASSAWAGQFRDDIRVAKAVFFVGYSLSDLDVQRLLFETTIIKDKCVFVVGENPSGATAIRAKKFGEMLNISTKDFAREIDAFKRGYTPPDDLEFFGECLQEYKNNDVKATIQDRHVFNLVLYGKYRSSFISTSINNNVLYYRERDELKDVFDQLDKGKRVVIIHSELGNGKTLFIEGIKLLASQRGYNVYDVKHRTNELLNEIDTTCRSGKKTLLVFENYFEWNDAIKYFIKNSSSNSVAILTARTPAYEVTVDDLYKHLGTSNIPEINVDKLGPSDLNWTVNLFDHYGLWAEKASSTRKQKLDFLKKHHQDFSSILLGLLRSPLVISKFRQVLDQLNNKREYYQVIISILALSVMNYETTIDRLIDFWGDIIMDPKFKNDNVVSQLIEFERGEIQLRSSTLSRYLLRHVVDGKIVVDTLIHLRQRSEEKLKTSDYYKTLSKNLVRFHNLQNLLPEVNKKTAILYYYESIKNLASSKENPLFWLQYGIACLVLKEFERTEKYLSTAYAYAKQTPNFDVFQIDNHYARYLLEKSIETGADANFMGIFRKARGIIDGQIRKETLHYPYKVAQLYADFYLTYESRMSPTEKNEIASVASGVMSRIGRLPIDKQNQEYISQCNSSMQTILERASGV